MVQIHFVSNLLKGKLWTAMNMAPVLGFTQMVGKSYLPFLGGFCNLMITLKIFQVFYISPSGSLGIHISQLL